ncbi:serine hydrolase [Pedobacter boryungensis]|uniref:beta-lactamase n=2 Tax=Pedobacter boryungensis TaxID=869962 RepID=A0ABX2DA03_9SPHI|nr:serine hydrolase [Pedobacter boryungensis]NQX30869.1 serine hydrolase [Pedobacter boryungensis]
MRKLSLCLLFLISYQAMAQKTDTLFLKKLMEDKPELFSAILNHRTHNEIQVIYTQVNRDKNNKPSFKTFTYNVNAKRYFYPASTVKLAGVIFALEKVNELKSKGLTANLTMITDSSFKGQTKVSKDKSAVNGKPSLAHYIKKVLLTSDNDAFNRLFEFLGRSEINVKLKKYGLTESRILNRLAIGDGGESARHTNPIDFYDGDKLIYYQPEQYDAKDYPLELTNLIVGKGYMDSNEKLVNEPYSFENKNVFTVADQQSLMKRLIMPEAYPTNERFNLTPEDYKLIYTYMSKYPTESDYPKYNEKEFWSTYAKMLYYGREKNAVLDPNIRIFNKYGDSYGFIIDNSYFVDFKNKVEYFLTAVVQSNEDGIYNDGKYEYETVCYPFMKNLGRTIYEYELNRAKKQLPDLSKFKLDYLN